MASLNSYNLEGLKENFAEWIATITPDKTPFISCLGIDAVNGTDFKWLADRGSYTTDFLDNVQTGAYTASKEGDASVSSKYDFAKGMEQYENYTQIFRRVIKISDTVLNSSVYGRDTELSYQLAKAGIDLKKEIEFRFLSKQDKREGSDTAGPMTAGFFKQCATPTDATAGFPTTSANADTQTGAITSISVTDTTKVDSTMLNKLTQNLFQAGVEATCITYNPKSEWIVDLFHFMANGDKEVPSQTRLQWFKQTEDGDSREIMTYTDNIGQTFRLIPNYWMPLDTIYFFAPEDWDMVVYREPVPKQLDSDGSYQVWMVECEVGLRHAHKFASGVITKA